MNMTDTTIPTTELVSAPLFRQQVLEYLRDRIMSGELPSGTPLTPTALAKQLNTSAMPVREALRVLEQEGLVEVSGRRYTRVAILSREVADEAYPLIWLLEAQAVRQASGLPADALAEARDANAMVAKATSTPERLRAVLRFHRAICSAAGPLTRQMLETLYARVGLIESIYAREYESAVPTAEHDEILEAIERGDVETAAALTEEHWRHGYDAILPYLNGSHQP